ncbi:MAG TPA: tRNA (adenosine(37)-N6)-dimethylallyltransferase MiaA [Ignavibacteria bacterium]|nr:tRNA (adenosine(37)-N6)-dimethylallyltransferase MiaA [Ignavibacteria bacterium]
MTLTGKKKALAIVGPTASGKTSLSVEVAKKLDCEIISADSRQIYKHIPVATSCPTETDLKSVKHNFIEDLDLNITFNAGEFGKKGREIAEEIFSRNKIPLITGGSGLYVRSLIDGLFEVENGNENIKDIKEIRDGLYAKLEKYGEDELYKELKLTDESAYNKIPKGKIRRVIRALEVFYSTNRKLSDFHNESTDISFETVQIGLLLDRKYLYERINNRVDDMIKNGLLEEVEELKKKGLDYRNCNSLNTVGIKEVFKFFENEFDYETMVSLIKQNSRRYAKRQMTWFRKDERINWVIVKEDSETKALSYEVIEIFQNSVE